MNSFDDLKKYFKNNEKQYYHDLLNDKFYDEVVFLQKTNGYYVEIGALDGWQQSQTIHFEYLKDWNGIVVEPSPQWFDSIHKFRNCNICTNPISDKRETNKFVVRDSLAYSHMSDIGEIYGPEDVKEIIDVETITLCDLFDKYKSPGVIDFVAIDTEGYELRILKKYFEENNKYKINLISFETGLFKKELDDLLTINSYFEIKNPFLDFIKVDVGGLGTVRLRDDNTFKNDGGDVYDSIILDLENVEWEKYYIHIDFLKNNMHLKKYLK